MYYNFICTHKTLRTTPAMAAGVTSRLREIGDIVDVLEPWEAVQVDHGEAVLNGSITFTRPVGAIEQSNDGTKL